MFNPRSWHLGCIRPPFGGFLVVVDTYVIYVCEIYEAKEYLSKSGVHALRCMIIMIIRSLERSVDQAKWSCCRDSIDGIQVCHS